MFKLLILATFFINTSHAKSASFFEPYVGISSASFKEDLTAISGTSNGTTINSQNGEVSGDFSGVNLGLRVYEKYLDQFMLGGDLGLGVSSGKLNLNVLNSLGNYQIVTFTPGIIVGWDIPTILFPRIWAGFYPFNSLHLSADTDNSDVDKYSGHSYKFGVSFDWWIQLGFEYSSHQYKFLNGHDLPYRETVDGISMTQEKVKYEEVIFTVSYPFSI